MTLIDYIIALGRELVGLTPGPAGSTLDPTFAETIATDLTKLLAAQSYWRARFADLNSGAFSLSPVPDWLAFTKEASNVDYSVWAAQRDTVRNQNEFNAIDSTGDTGPH
jgi:hypothetical protein